MSSAGAVKRYIRELAKRATVDPPSPGTPAPPARAAGDLAGLDVARQHAQIDSVPANARLRRVKTLMLRAGRVFTQRQASYNEAVLVAFGDVAARLDENGAGGAAVVAGMEAAIVGVDERIDDLDAKIERVAALGARQQELRAEVQALRSRLDVIVREARAALPDALNEDQLRRISLQLDHSNEQLYRDFENTFRGSRDDVRRLVTEYIRDVADLPGRLLDVGCGRGEWLEVLTEHDIAAYGVDTNEHFAEENAKRGLEVVIGDALAHMHALDDASLGAVTAFHVIEHLPLDAAVDLVDSALRVLRPGGLLILETPNPSNLVVGASSFYLDPTHLKPVHPSFLAFLVEARGFVDVETRYLHPTESSQLDVPTIDGVQEEGLRRLVDSLNWALWGPQDYAVLARKATPAR